MKLSLIAAFSEDLIIGQDNDLPWRLPEDMKRFKAYTLGSWLVMGRNTWESIGQRPLPDRTTIIVSSKLSASDVPKGVFVARSYVDAVEVASRHDADNLIACGGEGIYREALPLATEACVTTVLGRLGAGVRFPKEEWLKFVMRSDVVKVDRFETNGHACSWEIWQERMPHTFAH